MKHEIQCIKLKDLGLIILVIFSDPAKYPLCIEISPL